MSPFEEGQRVATHKHEIVHYYEAIEQLRDELMTEILTRIIVKKSKTANNPFTLPDLKLPSDKQELTTYLVSLGTMLDNFHVTTVDTRKLFDSDVNERDKPFPRPADIQPRKSWMTHVIRLKMPTVVRLSKAIDYVRDKLEIRYINTGEELTAADIPNIVKAKNLNYFYHVPTDIDRPSPIPASVSIVLKSEKYVPKIERYAPSPIVQDYRLPATNEFESLLYEPTFIANDFDNEDDAAAERMLINELITQYF